MHCPPAAGRESITCALRPSKPSSNTWNNPTGPAPTMTTSVSIAGPSINANCESRDTTIPPTVIAISIAVAAVAREPEQALLFEPRVIEQPRQVLRPAIAEHGYDSVPRTKSTCHLDSRCHVDAAGAAEEQAFFVQQAIDAAYGFTIFDMH